MDLAEGHLNIKKEQRGDVLILYFKGRLDALSSPPTEQKIFEAVQNGQLKIILELSQVNFICTEAIRVFLSAMKKLKAMDGKLILCAVHTNVLDVFKMSGFDHLLEMTLTEEEALRKLSA